MESLTSGIKLYNTGQLPESIEFFLKSTDNTASLYYLCTLSTTGYDTKINIIKLLKCNLNRYSIKTRLELLNIISSHFPRETYLLYLQIYNQFDLIPRIKLYILHQLVSNATTNADMASRLQHCKAALDIQVSDKFVCLYMLTRPYLTSSDPITPVSESGTLIDLNEHFETNKHVYTQPIIRVNQKKDHTNIGFVTSDLDKNGLCMFSRDIINSLDPKKFKVFVYYDDSHISYNNQSIKTNNDVTWVSIYEKHTNTIYHQIHETHKIDILFDLVTFRSPKIVRLFATRPAPVQINYLGYSNDTHLDCYTHTLPNIILWKTLTPVTGINFQPTMLSTNRTQIIIGIMNSPLHISLKCVMTYNAISSRHKNVLFVVKSTTPIPKLKNVLYITTPTTSLEDYYNIFNGFDYVIDTFPYSGTTTTAASLYMGCPVLTFYNPDALSTSNSSSSMNINSGLSKYVFKSLPAILKFDFKQFRDNYNRKQLRKKFLNCMNPVTFLNCFEKMLLNYKIK